VTACWRVRALVAACLVVGGCGSEISLGGTADSGTGTGAARPCEPCTASLDCSAGLACAQFAGDLFCATPCAATGSACAASETCAKRSAAGGTEVDVCIPPSDQCSNAPPPSRANDGGATCGQLSGPDIPSGCSSCGKYSDDCQANGCYGGWWCNTATLRCEAPPEACE
jgi:hypothetical protein